MVNDNGLFGHHQQCNGGILAGRPILHAEGHFVACHFIPCQYVPFTKIGRGNLKDILRKATDKTKSHERKVRKFFLCQRLRMLNKYPLIHRLGLALCLLSFIKERVRWSSLRINYNMKKQRNHLLRLFIGKRSLKTRLKAMSNTRLALHVARTMLCILIPDDSQSNMPLSN